jgi:hypothetical protein
MRSPYCMCVTSHAARQRLGKHIPAAKNTHATIEERLTCCWPSPTQWFLVPSPTGIMTIFYCLTALGAFKPPRCGRAVFYAVRAVSYTQYVVKENNIRSPTTIGIQIHHYSIINTCICMYVYMLICMYVRIGMYFLHRCYTQLFGAHPMYAYKKKHL